MIASLLGGSFSQIAYVTTDFDAALKLLSERFGVRRFLELRDIDFVVQPDGATARCHVGLAMAGGLQIELIEPRGGADSIYRDALPGEGFAVRLHHFAQALPTLEALQALRHQVEDAGLAIVVDGQAPQGMTYFYADARDPLGHYFEFTWSTPEFLAAMAQAIPVN